jgi:hypothetical protein
LIPTPPTRRQNGFPWLGLILALVIVVGAVAYWIGGTRAMLLTAIFYGVIAGPLALGLIIFGGFRAGTRRSDERPGE